MGQSPGHMLPRVVQLVQCLHPYGSLSHSQKGFGAVPGGYSGQCSVKRRLPLTVTSWYSFMVDLSYNMHIHHTHSPEKFQNSLSGFLFSRFIFRRKWLSQEVIIQVHEIYLVYRKSLKKKKHIHTPPFWVVVHELTQFKDGMPVLEFFCKLCGLCSLFFLHFQL